MEVFGEEGFWPSRVRKKSEKVNSFQLLFHQIKSRLWAWFVKANNSKIVTFLSSFKSFFFLKKNSKHVEKNVTVEPNHQDEDVSQFESNHGIYHMNEFRHSMKHDIYKSKTLSSN